jgi:histidinol-phosphate aminotransferase
MSMVAQDEQSLTDFAPGIRARDSLSVPIFNIAPRPDGVLLDSNEFRFPLPERFLARLARELTSVDLRHYPDAACAEKVKIALAEYVGVEPENLLLGVGSSELLDLICRVFGEVDHKLVAVVPSFPMYAQYANLNGREFVPVALESDFSLSWSVAKNMLSVPGSKAFFVCNPNNPTGRSIGRAAFEALASDPRAMLCLDEAYAEYAGNSYVAEAAKRDNVVVTRSLSKIGLAGCRFGYLVASKALVREIAKGALPYTVNSLTLRAVQIFLEEIAGIKSAVEDVKRERTRLLLGLSALPGFRPEPSETNFVLCAAPGDARALAQNLAQKHRIFIRAFAPQARLRNHLRIGVGLREENDALLSALREEARILSNQPV